MVSQKYVHVTSYWEDIEAIYLLDPNGSFLGVHSPKFLSASNTNTGEYLVNVLKSIATFPEGTTIYDLTRSAPLRMQSPIEPGQYQVQCDPALFQLKVGPVKHFLRSLNMGSLRIISGVPSHSTPSHSSRSSDSQSQFRETLFLRDETCVISQTKALGVVYAIHIVPFAAGPEFLQQVVSPCQLDPNYDSNYHPENGLLMAPTFHVLFDRYDIGLYYDHQRKAAVVHDFTQVEQSYHGRIIHFHETEIPNVNPKALH